MTKPTLFKAIKWSVASELISKALQPFIFVVLARLLTPNDYGVVAAAAMVISFTQIFWEAGMAKALIQRQSEINESANVAFWVNLLMGIVFAVVLFFLSDAIAEKLFHDVRVSNVLKVMTLQVFLGALASVHTALLQKEMKFDRLFWVRLSTVAVPGLFSIPLAWYGYSYWALVAGTLAGQFVQVAVLWLMSSWRPARTFDVAVARQLLKFGSWVGLSGLLSWFFLWVDSLFIGSYLGTAQLGLYRTGNQFIAMVYGLLFTPILPVLYSYFSRMQNDPERLRALFLKIIRTITVISVPLAILIFTISDQIGEVVFGAKWTGIGFVLAVMALLNGYAWIVGANGEVYRAIGKPSYETIVSFITLFVYLGGYYLSIQQGFETFVWTRFYLSLFGLALHLIFGWIALRLSVWVIVKTALLATVLGLVTIPVEYVVKLFVTQTFMQGALTGILALLPMAGILFLLERNGLIRDFRSLWNNRKEGTLA